MELVPALPSGNNEARVLEHLEVLGDGLPGGAEAVFHCQSAADLEQRLPVVLDELLIQHDGQTLFQSAADWQ